MIPFLNFSIGLRMLNSSQDTLDIIFSKKNIECAIGFTFLICLVCEELLAMIGYYFSDLSNLAIIL